MSDSDNMVMAVGGPLDEMRVPCRCPAGLVLINKPKGEALVYDRHADRIIARQIDVLDDQRAADTALGERYDVLAYAPERMGPWQR